MLADHFASIVRIVSGSTSLQASSTTSTSQIVSVSGAALLIAAWLVCVFLIGAGVRTKKAWLVSSGVVPAGIMTIATPLVYYVSETLRLGVFEASIQDFLLLTALSALGGGIITLGMLRYRQSIASHSPSERR